MAKKIYEIGKISVEQLRNADKKASREIELENSTGWTAKHKVHKSMKEYSRNEKHKNNGLI
jgi:hypothetical protein